ncbi:DUF2194 domain-containing protein [Clostridium sediminicola]|uniref:DUF2194 domain-containing protein n=1 Tax=Clostridium sediminicola TaxID=3114879 RepID=UPI0031F22DD1
MNNKKRDIEVKNENYFAIASIIFLLFVLMMTITNLNYYIRKSKENLNMEAKNTIPVLEEGKKVELNQTCLIVAGEDKNNSLGIVEESLEKAKIGYNSKTKFEDITDKELNSAEIIIINGSEFSSLGNVEMVYEYLKKDKHIIFTSMPDAHFVETSKLHEIMGIKNITKFKNQEGVKFLSGFMLGGLLEFPELSYDAPNIELLSTTKIYATGFKDSPLIWRNIFDESEIYVVNGQFFETNAGFGILSAIMAQIYPDYIYPVVNAKVFTYMGLPYVSDENTSEIEEIYSRNTMQLQQDILIPDILSINKSRKFIPNGFFTDSFNKDNRKKIDGFNANQINNYGKDIYKLNGEVGMVYSGDLEKDIEIYHNLFSKNFESLYLNEEDVETLNEAISKDKFSFIESVFGPWTSKNKSFGYLNKSSVYIPFTIDGVPNADSQKLEFYAGVTAFGTIIQNLNFKQIIYPEDDRDNWMNVSREYIKFIDSYREKFQMIEERNISDTAQVVKKFEINSPSIEYFNNKIEIRLEEWYGEAYFILRTNKAITSINEGTIEKIEEGAYLVTAKNKKVDINLGQIDRYK